MNFKWNLWTNKLESVLNEHGANVGRVFVWISRTRWTNFRARSGWTTDEPANEFSIESRASPPVSGVEAPRQHSDFEFTRRAVLPFVVRDFRISFRRVGIPRANEERSTTLVGEDEEKGTTTPKVRGRNADGRVGIYVAASTCLSRLHVHVSPSWWCVLRV